MSTLSVVFNREFKTYFATPIAAIFIVIFLALGNALTFFLGGFFDKGQADLQSFFNFHPWLYLFLIPAVTMRLWAEERKTGTIEFFLTLPISMRDAVLGKFLAAWAFTGVALILTIPLWLTVTYLGDPDHGVIFASYVGSFLMAGAFLALGSMISALTKNQVIAFVITATVCFLMVMSGSPMTMGFLGDWAPAWLADGISGLSFLTHFNQLSQGVIRLVDVIFFVSIMVGALGLNIIFVDQKKAA
jgi:ABC-2 type transport system permease protein